VPGFSSLQVQHLKVVMGRFLSRDLFCRGISSFQAVLVCEFLKGTEANKMNEDVGCGVCFAPAALAFRLPARPGLQAGL